MSDTLRALFDAWAGQEFWDAARTFLSLVLGSLGIALLIGIPAGILLTRLPRLSGPIIAALALLQTFPSLALLGLLIPLLGVGQPAAIFLAVVYSLFPVVMNVYIGITQVPPAIRDAARGMGMTGRQILWQVELPLALPVVLAGVRTGAVYAIGIITVSALAGAGGLGDYILRGMTQSNNLLIGVGALPLLALTLIVFWGLGVIAWVAHKHPPLGLVLGGGLIVLLSLHGARVIAHPFFHTRDEVRIGAKNFVEGEILAEVVKQLLEAHTDLRVEVVRNLTLAFIFQALQKGDIDLYPEYTGVLLMNKASLDMPVPKDRSTITTLVRAEMNHKHDMVLLETFGLNNTYVFCTTKSLAQRLGLRTIGDLRRHPKLRLVVDLSFLDRADGWEGLTRAYDLDLPRPKLMSPDLRYRALQTGDADIVLGFGTDWEITSHNLALLADNRNYFPSYHAVPLVRGELLRRYPQVATVLNRLQGQIDDETMRKMNYQVARERRPIAEVAREFLVKKGLVR